MKTGLLIVAIASAIAAILVLLFSIYPPGLPHSANITYPLTFNPLIPNMLKNEGNVSFYIRVYSPIRQGMYLTNTTIQGVEGCRVISTNTYVYTGNEWINVNASNRIVEIKVPFIYAETKLVISGPCIVDENASLKLYVESIR